MLELRAVLNVAQVFRPKASDLLVDHRINLVVTYRCDTMHPSTMRTTLFPFCLVAFCFSLLVSATPANAQCRADLIGFRIVTGNPFHAEIVTTPGPTQPESIVTRYPQLIARDSQGRVRTDRVTEEVKRGTGPDAGTNIETHIIMICDPVAHTTTILNVSKLTAEIVHLSPNGLSSSPVQGTPHTFCSSRMPPHFDRIAGADLGVQTIQGVEAHGARTHFGFASFSAGNTASGTSSDYVRDTWCSDDLSAIVLTAAEDPKTGAKSSEAMQNIVRTEPDPLLFQIPPDYTVTESVPGTHERHTKPAVPTSTQKP
jgi:hypothetical protein